MTRLLTAGLLLLAVPAAAQRTGTIEVGGFARYMNFDDGLGMGTATLVGGRAAVYLGHTFAVELDVGGTPGASVTYTPAHLRAVYEGPASPRVDALVGFGVVHNRYGAPIGVSDDGVSGLLGARYRLNDRVWVRIGVDLDVMFHTSDKSVFPFYNANWGLHFGAGVPINR